MTAAHVENAAAQAAEQPQPVAHDPTRPLFYRRVDTAAALAPEAFEPMDGATARLRAPLLVQSPTVVLASPTWDDGECPPHVHLAVRPPFAAFATEAEEAVLRAALANKDDWFRGRADDRTIVAAFKPLCKATGHLKVALPPEVQVFDASGELLAAADLAVGDHVRCILRLDGITFGRTEFGAMWTLVQAQTRPPPPAPPSPPRCLLSAEDDEEEGGPKPEPAGGAQEFL